ncbi:unnamed protein product [Rotaria magnacalcarata]|uniref:CCHC-type domain-containing protein n=3 Tax=Rotaria magnacalcarata TaxID=392030 RepID=A0A815Z6N1_9BILA|nr:unnamed protein product [Rotaria magnacalcarata]
MSRYQLLQEAVGLTLIKGDDRIDRSAIIAAIGKIVPVADLESFGNLGDQNKWFIIFKTNLSKMKFLELENLIVNEQTFAIHKPYREVKLIRLLNVPTAISNDYVRDITSKWGGTVINIECETLPRPYSNIKTFVRRIRIKFASHDAEQKVPLSIKIVGINVPVLLEGRLKVCYRCKESGHVKSECNKLKCQICYEIGHDDPACNKQRTYANVASASTTPLITPRIDVQVTRETPVVNKTQLKIKTCYRCKQPGHVQKDCIFNHNGVVHHSTPIPDDENNSMNSTPTVVDNHFDLDGPQLITMNDCDEPNLLAKETISCEKRQQQNRTTTTIDPVVLSNDNTMIQGPINILNAESYKMYKEGRNVLKRPFHDDHHTIVKDKKTEHHPSSLPDRMREDGEI